MNDVQKFIESARRNVQYAITIYPDQESEAAVTYNGCTVTQSWDRDGRLWKNRLRSDMRTEPATAADAFGVLADAIDEFYGVSYRFVQFNQDVPVTITLRKDGLDPSVGNAEWCRLSIRSGLISVESTDVIGDPRTWVWKLHAGRFDASEAIRVLDNLARSRYAVEACLDRVRAELGI